MPELDEGPSPEDVERFSDATVECPRCGARLHDDVDLCYKCGHALGAESGSTMPGRGALIAIVLVVLVLTGATGYWMRWW